MYHTQYKLLIALNQRKKSTNIVYKKTYIQHSTKIVIPRISQKSCSTRIISKNNRKRIYEYNFLTPSKFIHSEKYNTAVPTIECQSDILDKSTTKNNYKGCACNVGIFTSGHDSVIKNNPQSNFNKESERANIREDNNFYI